MANSNASQRLLEEVSTEERWGLCRAEILINLLTNAMRIELGCLEQLLAHRIVPIARVAACRAELRLLERRRDYAVRMAATHRGRIATLRNALLPTVSKRALGYGD